MEAQFRALAATRDRDARRTVDGIAVVAVGAGDGHRGAAALDRRAAVVRGGQTMNPSAGDIRAAIEATGAREVIVLPNNKNIVLAAELAVEGLPARCARARDDAASRRASRRSSR